MGQRGDATEITLILLHRSRGRIHAEEVKYGERTTRRCKLILQRTQAKFREGGVLTYALIHAQPWDEEHHSRDLFQLAEQGAPLVQFVILRKRSTSCQSVSEPASLRFPARHLLGHTSLMICLVRKSTSTSRGSLEPVS